MAKPLRGSGAEICPAQEEPESQRGSTSAAAEPSGGATLSQLQPQADCVRPHFLISSTATLVFCAAVLDQGDAAEGGGGVAEAAAAGVAVQRSPAGRGQPGAEGGDTAAQR